MTMLYICISFVIVESKNPFRLFPSENGINSENNDQCESNNATGLAVQSDSTTQHPPNRDRASTDPGRNQENSNRKLSSENKHSVKNDSSDHQRDATKG